MRRRAHQIAAWLRRRSGDAKDEVLALTGELARIADAALKDAHFVATNARRALQRAGDAASGKATALVTELERTIGALEQIVAQTRTRLGGKSPTAPPGGLAARHRRPTDRKGRLGTSRRVRLQALMPTSALWVFCRAPRNAALGPRRDERPDHGGAPPHELGIIRGPRGRRGARRSADTCRLAP